jgi:YHS domain-containing protein
MANYQDKNLTGKTIINNELTKVENKYVCMITNKLFDTPQIPVEIEDKTYYGCCMGCKAKLENYPDTRYAIDPVSNNKVNKATAIIGVTPSGKILYFESQENFDKYK